METLFTHIKKTRTGCLLLLELTCAFILVVAPILAPPVALAATLEWINPAGGAAGVSSNWNPAQVPGPTDSLVFGLPDIYAVSFGGWVPVLDMIILEDGWLAFDFVSNLNTINDLGISAELGHDSTLWIRSGSPTFTGRTYVGYAGGSGVLAVGAANPTWSGNLGVLVGAYSGSTGTLEVNDGASVVMENLDAGFGQLGDGGGSGTITIEGRSSTAPFSRSTLTAGSGQSDVTIGWGQLGSGSLEVRDGALLDVQTNLALA